jgi:hypothetical protein
MAAQQFSYMSRDGMVTIDVDVPDEFSSPELRRAFCEGAGAGGAAMLDQLLPDLEPDDPDV